MKLLNPFVLAMLMILGSGTRGLAQPLKLRHSPAPSSLAEPQKVKPQENVLEAVIVDIDYELGVLVADTELGLIHLHLAPEEARAFQIGETIEVHVLSAATLVI